METEISRLPARQEARTFVQVESVLVRTVPVSRLSNQSALHSCLVILNPAHTIDNGEATLSNATKSNVASTKSDVALTLLLVWTGLYTYNEDNYVSQVAYMSVSDLSGCIAW